MSVVITKLTKLVTLKIIVGFFSFFCDLAPQLGCWFAARSMHLSMLKGVLRSPLVFFDVTPQGRILARFSKDIDVLDTGLPQQISDTVYCCFEVRVKLSPAHKH